MFALRSMAGALRSFWSGGQPIERVGYTVGALLIVSGSIHLAILIVTGGSWEGPLSLRKPATFGLSFGLTLITVTWVAAFLRLGDRARTILLATFAAACALETALVSMQAWRGVPSHFNMETTFDAFVARTLAGGGLALVAVIVVLTLAAFRPNRAVPISLRIAIQLGFVMLIGAAAVGAVMIAKGMVLVFGGHAQAAYATGGTLKPTHAVAMHGILVLPALAWVVSFADWSERRRLGVVFLAAAGYIALAGAVATANVAGLGLRQGPVGLVALLGALSVLAGCVAALRAVARAPAFHGVQRG